MPIGRGICQIQRFNVIQTVTEITLKTPTEATFCGENVQFDITVTPTVPDGGTVNLINSFDNSTLGSGTLTSNMTSITTSFTGDLATYPVTAKYLGSSSGTTSYVTSTSEAVDHDITADTVTVTISSFPTDAYYTETYPIGAVVVAATPANNPMNDGYVQFIVDYEDESYILDLDGYSSIIDGIVDGYIDGYAWPVTIRPTIFSVHAEYFPSGFCFTSATSFEEDITVFDIAPTIPTTTEIISQTPLEFSLCNEEVVFEVTVSPDVPDGGLVELLDVINSTVIGSGILISNSVSITASFLIPPIEWEIVAHYLGEFDGDFIYAESTSEAVISYLEADGYMTVTLGDLPTDAYWYYDYDISATITSSISENNPITDGYVNFYGDDSGTPFVIGDSIPVVDGVATGTIDGTPFEGPDMSWPVIDGYATYPIFAEYFPESPCFAQTLSDGYDVTAHLPYTIEFDDPRTITYDGYYMWVGNAESPIVQKIHPHLYVPFIISILDLDSFGVEAVRQIKYDAYSGKLLAACKNSQLLLVIDPILNSVIGKATLDGRARAVTFDGAGNVWASIAVGSGPPAGTSHLYKFSIADMIADYPSDATASIHYTYDSIVDQISPEQIVYSDNYIWMTHGQNFSKISRITPADGTVTNYAFTGGLTNHYGFSLVAAYGSIWVVGGLNSGTSYKRVYRFDPGTFPAAPTIIEADGYNANLSGGMEIFAMDNYIWVTTYQLQRLLRISTGIGTEALVSAINLGGNPQASEMSTEGTNIWFVARGGTGSVRAFTTGLGTESFIYSLS